MVVPILMLTVAGLLIYAGIHDMTVTDALGTLLGRQPSHKLGSLGNIGQDSSGQSSGNVAAGILTASTKVAGHPELRANISQIVNVIRQQFPRLIITSTISGGHASASYHYFGEAADLSINDSNYMAQAAQWISANLTSLLTEGIHNSGLSVKNGKPVDPSFWGSAVWSQHVNHIHVAAAQNSVSSPPGF